MEGEKSSCLDFCSCCWFSYFRGKEEAWRPLTLVAQALLGTAPSATALQTEVALGKVHEMKTSGDK